jgi:hypothetical protein
MKSIETTWELWSYDVWGNAADGYEVNDRSCWDREYPLTLQIEINNPGTPHEFLSAYPSDKQIRDALGCNHAYRLELEKEAHNGTLSLWRTGRF